MEPILEQNKQSTSSPSSPIIPSTGENDSNTNGKVMSKKKGINVITVFILALVLCLCVCCVWSGLAVYQNYNSILEEAKKEIENDNKSNGKKDNPTDNSESNSGDKNDKEVENTSDKSTIDENGSGNGSASSKDAKSLQDLPKYIPIPNKYNLVYFDSQDLSNGVKYDFTLSVNDSFANVLTEIRQKLERTDWKTEEEMSLDGSQTMRFSRNNEKELLKIMFFDYSFESNYSTSLSYTYEVKQS